MQHKKPQPSAIHNCWTNQEKLSKIGQKPIFHFKKKLVISASLTGFFQKRCFAKGCVFFCVAFNVARRLIWAFQINNWNEFLIFHLLILGGVKSYLTWKKRSTKISEKNKSNQGAKWNKKMVCRSFVITCGAFKDTLLAWV